MKIVHILPGVEKNLGGTVTCALEMANAQRQAGNCSTLVALDPTSATVTTNSTTIQVPASRGGYRHSPLLSSWIEKNSRLFDIAIIHGLWQSHSYQAWKGCVASNLPYVIYPHGMLDQWFRSHHPIKHLKKMLYWKLIENKVIRDARAVLFTSEEEKRNSIQTFRPWEAQRDFVTPLGIAEPEFKGEKNPFLERYPELSGHRVLLYLGRIHSKKGVDLLIQSWKRIVKQDSKFRLVVAGPMDSSGYGEGLKNSSENLGVHWVGMLEGEMKWGALRTAEAFILPSHQENFGLAVAEALACGVPVLISNKVNVWREIVEDKAGLVDDDTLEGTSRLITRWMKWHPDDRLSYTERARNCYLKRYRISEAAVKLQTILKSLLP